MSSARWWNACSRSGERAAAGGGAGLADARIAALLLGHSAYWSGVLNFVRYADENEPYVYVQTMTDVNKLMDPLRNMVALDKSNYHLKGVVLLEKEGDNHPLPWLLGDFTGVEFLHEKSPARETMDADFLFIQDPFVSDVEDRLRHPYFREKITLRGSSELTGELYFDAEKFAAVFPGRAPEFQPAARPSPPRPRRSRPSCHEFRRSLALRGKQRGALGHRAGVRFRRRHAGRGARLARGRRWPRRRRAFGRRAARRCAGRGSTAGNGAR